MSPQAFVDLQAAIAMVLLGLALPALARAYVPVVRTFRGDPSARPLVGICALAALVRVLVPKWLVTVHIGYLLTEQSHGLSTASHYGLGSQALPHALFALLPYDYRSILWAHAALSLLALPLVATLAATIAADRRVGVGAAALLAFLPIFVKHDVSEANQIPAMLGAIAGLVLLQEHLRTGGGEALAGATALLSFAAIARPEMPLLVPVFAATIALTTPDVRAGLLRSPRTWAALACFALLVSPHALQTLAAARSLDERGSLPLAGSHRVVDSIARAWLRKNTALTPTIAPLALPLLALAALALRRTRRVAARLLLFVAFALALYGVDLCNANMARVHVPAVLVLAIVASLGAIGLVEQVDAPRRRLVAMAIAALVVITAIPGARRLWTRTNEQEEDEMLEVAIAHLPTRSPFTWVHVGDGDRIPGSAEDAATHLHVPDYLVRPPARPGRTSSITDFLDDPSFDVPVYAYVGTRCYAAFRPEGSPPPHGENLRPACARLRERFRLEPIVERTIPNHGDVWLAYYGDAPTLRLGLYRVRPLGSGE